MMVEATLVNILKLITDVDIAEVKLIKIVKILKRLLSLRIL